MHGRLYALASIGAAIAVAGCGSSTKRTAGTTPPASSTAANAAVLSPAAPGGEGTPGLRLRASKYGKVVFATNHRVLYTFGADHGTTSTCYGVCASAWPPLLSKRTPSVGNGLDAKLLGTTRRKDGSIQVTYGGHPLYYYSADQPNKIMCQAANMHGGFWYVVNPDGSANKATGHGTMMVGHGMMKEHGKM